MGVDFLTEIFSFPPCRLTENMSENVAEAVGLPGMLILNPRIYRLPNQSLQSFPSPGALSLRKHVNPLPSQAAIHSSKRMQGLNRAYIVSPNFSIRSVALSSQG